MNATRLIEDWRRQGLVLEVEGANTVLWRMGQGETVICVHGVPTSGFLYRKLLPELASRGLEGVTLDLPGLGLAGRPVDFDYSWSGFAAWYLKVLDLEGYEVVSGKHFLQEDSSRAIASLIARLINASGSAAEPL